MTVHHNQPCARKYEVGATLIELIVTIIIISVSLSGILSIVNLTTRRSADPIMQYQAIAIAESYIEEISLLPVTANPDRSVAGNRASFDNIEDYNGLSDSQARDQSGNVIAGLENYAVTVAISNDTLSSIVMKVITVTVSRSGTQDITITGYKADY